MEAVAKRLAEEASSGRQVIVFTHNILFHHMLWAAARRVQVGRHREWMGAYIHGLTGGRLARIGNGKAAPSRRARDPSLLSTPSAKADHDVGGTVRFEPDTPRRFPERLSASRSSSYRYKPQWMSSAGNERFGLIDESQKP